MKKIVLIAPILSVFAFLFAVSPVFSQADYAREWEEVDNLLQQKLPQSAEKIIDGIYMEALAQNNVAQLVKAHLYRTYTLNSWDNESIVWRIDETEDAITKSSAPAKNILHSIAAEFYWNYYTKNRSRILNHTATETASDDIHTWDLRRLIEKCVEHHSASLMEPETLQKTTLEPLSAMLQKADGSEKYRPTLYDFLVFRAVEFYDQNDAGLTQPAERFTVNDPRYFASANDFSALSITASDTLSFKFRALTLLQQIIAFHLHDTEPTVLIDADLLRLDFVLKQSTLSRSQEEQLYLDTLQALDTLYANHPSSTEILFRMARVYKQQGDAFDPFTNPSVRWKKQDAMESIEKAIARFPESFGAQNCIVLRDEIKQPTITVQLNADDATLPGKPFLMSVIYQNIPILHYRIVPVDFKQALEHRENKRDMIDFYDKINPVHSGQWNMPGHEDYQMHTAEMAMPGLNEGYYVILASADPNFPRDSFLVERPIWVTNISYVQQSIMGVTSALLVLHRETGKPLSGVSVQEYSSAYNSDKKLSESRFGNIHISDANGLIHLRDIGGLHLMSLHFTNGEDQYASSEDFTFYSTNSWESASKITTATTLFCDRAIYRPGQTVYFKGIVLQWKGQEADIAAGSMQTVSLHNFYSNFTSEKVSDITVTTNEFGSFSGSFVIPSVGLEGRMYLKVEPANGRFYFRVREYKQPKLEADFEVEFEPVKDAYRLGEEITVTGKAMSYAGNAVNEAKVSYRVTREARYPLWRWWWGQIPRSYAQEIKNGETATREDGTFDISFTAIPDTNIEKKNAPVFHYTVSATVSDINGETRRVRTTIPVGYQSLMISANIPEKMNSDDSGDINITAANLNGHAQAVRGILTISKLRDPGRVIQERLWRRPDQFSMTREEFTRLFPNNVYDVEVQVGDWEKDEEVCRVSFDTGTSATYPLPNIQKWSSGTYIAELKTKDVFGEDVENSNIFTLFSVAQGSIPANEPIWFHVLNPIAQPGDTVKILLGSAYPNVEAYYEIVGKDRKPRRESISLNNEQKMIEIPVTENDRGNFAVQFFFVKNNRPYSVGQVIQVPYDNNGLNMEFATFRNKLLPGEEEEWRVTIKDKAGDAVAAELLASMYDASLDTFASHAWDFPPTWKNTAFSFSWRTDPAFRNRQSAALVAQIYSRFTYFTRSYDGLLNSPSFFSLASSYPPFPGVSKPHGITRIGVLADDMPLAQTVKYMAAYTELSENRVAEIEKQPAVSVQVRENFNETAFFYPQLRTNEKGETVISFTVPEAITRWKMQGVAWTKDLKVGMVTKEIVTQKDLTIFADPPRFFRENDTLLFSAKLSNISDSALDIKSELQFFDALTMKPVSERLLLEPGTKNTRLEPNGNQVISWEIHIPDGLQTVAYRVTAISGSFSDGEESIIPVLTNRMMVTVRHK